MNRLRAKTLEGFSIEYSQLICEVSIKRKSWRKDGRPRRWKIQAQRPKDFGKVEYVLRAWLASLQVLMGADQQQGLPSYYSILGVSSESSFNEIKRAYRKLAMQWHPDRLTRTPSLLGEAKRKFQQIQEAYAVLSDHRKRTMYDAGLYDPEDQEDEGLSDFVQEILNLMAQDKRQNCAQDKSYSMEELQTMLLEMTQGFETSSWYSTPSILEEPRNSKRARCDADPMMDRGSSHFSLSGWGVYGCS